MNLSIFLSIRIPTYFFEHPLSLQRQGMRIYGKFLSWKVWSNYDIMSAEFYNNCLSKKRPYQNVNVLFTLNVMEKE